LLQLPKLPGAGALQPRAPAVPARPAALPLAAAAGTQSHAGSLWQLNSSHSSCLAAAQAGSGKAPGLRLAGDWGLSSRHGLDDIMHEELENLEGLDS
jgi:hypothetical protein